MADVMEGNGGKICLLSSDARFAAAMAHELTRIGLTPTVLPVPTGGVPDIPAGVALVVADGDCADDEVWEVMCRATDVPWVIWARRAVNLPGVTVLHRPFDLAVFVRTVQMALGDVRPTISFPEARPPAVESAPMAEIPLVRVVEEGILAVGSERVSLTPSEWAIYRCLAEHCGTVVSREILHQCLVGGGGNSVDVYVCHLRAKLEKPMGVRMIWTVRGEGYRMATCGGALTRGRLVHASHLP